MLSTGPAWKQYEILETKQQLNDMIDDYHIILKGVHSFRGEETIAFYIINDKIREESTRKDKLVKFKNNYSKNKINIIYLVTDVIIKNKKVFGNSMNKKIVEINNEYERTKTKIYPLLYLYFYNFTGPHKFVKTVTIEKIKDNVVYNLLNDYPKDDIYVEGTMQTIYTNIGRDLIYLNMVCEDCFIKRVSLAPNFGDNSGIFRAKIDYNLYAIPSN